MTPQEVFDTVVNHLRKQGKQALTNDPSRPGRCLYRAEDGSKCAVGCLIPDAQYEPYMEQSGTVVGLFERYYRMPFVVELYPHQALLNELQQIHDNQTPRQWEELWQRTTKRFQLTYTPPAFQE